MLGCTAAPCRNQQAPGGASRLDGGPEKTAFKTIKRLKRGVETESAIVSRGDANGVVADFNNVRLVHVLIPRVGAALPSRERCSDGAL
jgi:hypothetical protein